MQLCHYVIIYDDCVPTCKWGCPLCPNPRRSSSPPASPWSSRHTVSGNTIKINRGPKIFSLCLNSKSMREKREGEKGKTQWWERTPFHDRGSFLTNVFCPFLPSLFSLILLEFKHKLNFFGPLLKYVVYFNDIWSLTKPSVGTISRISLISLHWRERTGASEPF